MSAGRSLRRRLAMLTSLGFAVVWLFATGLMAFVLHTEQEEMLDLTLRETATLFQPLLLATWQTGDRGTLPLGSDPDDPNEDLVYMLQDRDGTVFLRSATMREAQMPEGPPRQGFRTSGTHAFYTTAPDAAGRFVTFGDPKTERSEAFRDSLLGFVVPMLAMLPIAYLLVDWIVRTALRPLLVVQTEIAARDEGRLDPLGTDGLPQELQGITRGMNGLMERLGLALEGERAFATNAAHELRTPAAVALAQVQRLRAETTDAVALKRIDGVETALTRMSQLVARLLQLARAEAGIGAGRTDDLGALLDHVLRETVRGSDRVGRIDVEMPEGTVGAAVDADAWAIVAANLVDNALRYAPPGTQIQVRLLETGTLDVSNLLLPDTIVDVDRWTDRFHRGSRKGAGFGIGLHIAKTIAAQAGGTLDLRVAEREDANRFFEASFRVSRLSPADPSAAGGPLHA